MPISIGMNFPENIPDREEYIFKRVVTGNFSARWTEVSYSSGGRTFRANVMEDALKIDDVRVNVSAKLQQRLADLFGASLFTPLVADLVYISAVRRAEPRPMPISSTVSSMVKHSKNVDAQLKGDSGLASTVGKHWVLDKQLESNQDSACNYGWHFVGAAFQGIKGFSAASSLNSYSGGIVKVIQPNATAHNSLHSDYSQVCQLIHQRCWIDDVEYKFSDLLKDSELCYLVSHQGPLGVVRQPGVEEKTGLQVMFPVSQ